jgi:dienelactone hydrolase
MRTTHAAKLLLASFTLIAACGTSAGATEKVEIPATASTPAIPAYLARPSQDAAAPAVIVLHGCEGYRARYGAIADNLAKAGFVAIALDTLSPRRETNACRDRTGSRKEADDAAATIAWLRTQPNVDGSRIALLGYSMGAIAALDLADPFVTGTVTEGLRATVAYYPACRARKASNALVPILILDGDRDDWTPAEPCTALAGAAAAAGTQIRIVTYPNATHAFNVDLPERTAEGHQMRYDPKAAADAQTETLRFLHRNLLTP